MKIGILGLGEVGQAIKEIYLNNPSEREYTILVNDLKSGVNEFEEGIEFLNVCIPYSDRFEDIVESVYKKYKPQTTIIHTTVNVGTTKSLNNKIPRVVHSPIRGVHPKLYEGVKTFIKYIGYEDETIGMSVLAHFQNLGLKAKMFEGSKTTELGKLLSTTYYGLAIAFHDYADKLCKESGIKFEEVMTEFNNTYNEGYKELGMPNVVRPVLYSPNGKIGGHCILPNAKILKEQFGESDVLKMILDLE